MAFNSILFPDANHVQKSTQDMPNYFSDTNLDQIIDLVTAGKEEYNLKPFFYTRLRETDMIHYRHEVFRDLANENFFEQIKSFAKEIYSVAKNNRSILENLFKSDSYRCNYLEKGNFIDTVENYCNLVWALADTLKDTSLQSRGFLAFREYVTDYVESKEFLTLLSETKAMKADLATVKYCMLIENGTIKVRKYQGETDYSVEIENTLKKFQQGPVKDYRQKFREEPYAYHVEVGVLDLVAGIYPDIFGRLDRYCITNKNYIDQIIVVFAREIQFFIAWLDYTGQFEHAGLSFCYPKVSVANKEVYSCEGFDLSLAAKLLPQKMLVVCNDFYLKGDERVIVVTGPNQGGKTTFARVFGQLHHLAAIGCTVPGTKAQLFLCDNIFTHFEKEEDVRSLKGKLADELARMRDILSYATGDSIIILNEFLASTTISDALFIGKLIMERIERLDLLCVCVTFLDELASFGEKAVSMVSTINREKPPNRTFKILRKPADGFASAMSVAERYSLTYEHIKERIKT